MSTDSLVQPVIGCFGYPVAGNATQFVLERALRATQLDWKVFTAEVAPEQLEAAIRGAQAMCFAGLAVMPPYQGMLSPWLTEMTPSAQRSQHVSVIKQKNENWIGHDTRGEAVVALLRSAGLTALSIVVVDDETLGDLIKLADESSSNQVLHIDQVPDTYFLPEDESLPSTSLDDPPEDLEKHDFIHAIVLTKAMNPNSLKRLQALSFAPDPVGLIVQLENWDWQAQWTGDAWRWISPMDFLTQKSIENFRFWTGQTVAWNIVREALDEYHEW